MTLVNAIEPFVDATKAAEFLFLKPRRVLQLAREGKLPAHCIGDGQRRTWRFLLSELKSVVASRPLAPYSKPQAVSGRVS